MTVYAYPRLSKTDLWFIRVGGDGLGNLLFNWARCLSDSHEHGWRMVWPTWSSFKPNFVRQVASSTFDLLNEARVVFSDNGIECGLFGTMPAVGQWSGECGC